jgi:hypothetical protein
MFWSRSEDLLAGEVVVGGIVEGDVGGREAKLGVREEADGVGKTAEGDFDRDGDLFSTSSAAWPG